MDNPFDYYKDQVEYDYVILAAINAEYDQEVQNTLINEINSLFKNEDFLAIYFTKPSLGRVYGKASALESEIQLTFGICLDDANESFNSIDLQDSITNLINNLDKNIETDIVIKDSKIYVSSEPKDVKVDKLENLDKQFVLNGLKLVKESACYNLSLNDNGMIQFSLNDKPYKTMPFSKQCLTTECKKLMEAGYQLVENSLDDLNKTIDTLESADNLVDAIEKVDVLQGLKDELLTKVDTLVNESKEFPSTNTTSKSLTKSQLENIDFITDLTKDQQDWINTNLGSVKEFRRAIEFLFNELGDGDDPLISIDDYIKELSNEGGLK